MNLADMGHEIIFFGPPEMNSVISFDCVFSTNGSLHVLHSPPVIKGLRFFPVVMRRYFERRWLLNIESSFGKKIDIIWSFENSRFYDFSFAGSRLKLYQQVDLNQDFHPEVAAATADLSIAISEPIEDRLSPVTNNLVRITHGCASVKVCERKVNNIEQFFEKWRVNVILTGNLDIPYLDISLINQLVSAFPDVGFHFIGPYHPGKGLHLDVGSKDNAVFWGKCPSDSLHNYFQFADILLVTYLADKHREQLANPHKIMEYLASGKCVLATYTMEYDGREDLIEMASNRDEFIKKFLNIVRCPSAWNSPELMSYRQNFANSNSYPRQIERIADALGERGHLLSSRIFHDE